MKYFVFSFLVSLTLTSSSQAVNDINWMSIEQVEEAMKTQQKKVFIDLYTDWCGWCKRMDATTFKDPNVVQFMNQYFYAVKFNAERMDTVNFNNFAFYNLNPGGKRGTHLFAYSLLDGQMSYPSYAILDENLNRIHVVPGYKEPAPFASILLFFGTNQYQQYHNYVVKQVQQGMQQQNQQQPAVNQPK